MMTRDVLDQVARERHRQDLKWGGPNHDDGHHNSLLATYAAEMILPGQHPTPVSLAWKHKHPDSPSRKTRREQLIIGIALAVAEVERIDRGAIYAAVAADYAPGGMMSDEGAPTERKVCPECADKVAWFEEPCTNPSHSTGNAPWQPAKDFDPESQGTGNAPGAEKIAKPYDPESDDDWTGSNLMGG